MNIVAIASQGHFNTYLLSAIHRRWPLRCLIRPDWTAAAHTRSRWSRLRTAPWRTVHSALTRRWQGYRARTIDTGVGRILYGALPPILAGVEEVAIDRWRLNHFSTTSWLRSLEPDLLIVSAAPILKPAVLAVPRLGALNVHRGIAPDYRGEWSLFWALGRADFERIGITLHWIDEGVDTGPIVAHGFPALSPADDEASITAAFARLAANVVASAIELLGQGPAVGEVQPTRGRNYRTRERTMLREGWFWLKRKLLLERCPVRRERISWYGDFVQCEHGQVGADAAASGRL
jgi:hypothetical protein